MINLESIIQCANENSTQKEKLKNEEKKSIIQDFVSFDKNFLKEIKYEVIYHNPIKIIFFSSKNNNNLVLF